MKNVGLRLDGMFFILRSDGVDGDGFGTDVIISASRPSECPVE